MTPIVPGLFFAATLAVVVGPSFADARRPPEPSEVVRSLAVRGVQATLETDFSCETYEGSAHERIARAERAWIAVAERAIAVSDACYTEGIQSALGEAMRRAPRDVLPLVGKSPRLEAEYICLPFISAEQPLAQQLTEVRTSKRAIAAVRSAGLSKQRMACLRFIDGVEAGLRGDPASAKP